MFDYEALERALAAMQPRSKLYELVRKEMVKRKRWRNKPRGKSF